MQDLLKIISLLRDLLKQIKEKTLTAEEFNVIVYAIDELFIKIQSDNPGKLQFFNDQEEPLTTPVVNKPFESYQVALIMAFQVYTALLPLYEQGLPVVLKNIKPVTLEQLIAAIVEKLPNRASISQASTTWRRTSAIDRSSFRRSVPLRDMTNNENILSPAEPPALDTIQPKSDGVKPAGKKVTFDARFPPAPPSVILPPLQMNDSKNDRLAEENVVLITALIDIIAEITKIFDRDSISDNFQAELQASQKSILEKLLLIQEKSPSFKLVNKNGNIIVLLANEVQKYPKEPALLKTIGEIISEIVLPAYTVLSSLLDKTGTEALIALIQANDAYAGRFEGINRSLTEMLILDADESKLKTSNALPVPLNGNIEIQASGFKNNCAFNVFALFLLDRIVRNQFDDNHYEVARSHIIFLFNDEQLRGKIKPDAGVISWEDVKSFCDKYKQDSAQHLAWQHLLGPILRNYSVELSLKDHLYAFETLEEIQEEAESYVNYLIKKNGSRGDIYTPCPMVEALFKKLYSECFWRGGYLIAEKDYPNAFEKLKYKVSEFWLNDKNSRQFRKYNYEDVPVSARAITYLTQAFQVGFRVTGLQFHNHNFNLHSENGRIPANMAEAFFGLFNDPLEKDKVIRQLLNREIFQRGNVENDLRFGQIDSLRDLRDRLSNADSEGKILQYWRSAASKRNLPVPEWLDTYTVKLLLDRNILRIDKSTGTARLVFYSFDSDSTINAERILQARLEGVVSDGAGFIESFYSDFYHPQIELYARNDNAYHWDYITDTGTFLRNQNSHTLSAANYLSIGVESSLTSHQYAKSIYSFNFMHNHLNRGLVILSEIDTPKGASYDEVAALAEAAQDYTLAAHRNPLINTLLVHLSESGKPNPAPLTASELSAALSSHEPKMMPARFLSPEQLLFLRDIDAAIEEYFATLSSFADITFSKILADYYLNSELGDVSPEEKADARHVFLQHVLDGNIPLSAHLLIAYARLKNLDVVICEKNISYQPLVPLCRPVLHVCPAIPPEKKVYLLKTLDEKGEATYRPLMQIKLYDAPTNYAPTYISTGSGVAQTIRRRQPLEALTVWPFIQELIMDFTYLLHYIEYPEKDPKYQERIHQRKVKISMDLEKLIIGLGELEKFPKLIRYLCTIPRDFEALSDQAKFNLLQQWFDKIVQAVLQAIDVINVLYPIRHLGPEVAPVPYTLHAKTKRLAETVGEHIQNWKQSSQEARATRKTAFETLRAAKRTLADLHDLLNIEGHNRDYLRKNHKWIDPFMSTSAEKKAPFTQVHKTQQFNYTERQFLYVEETQTYEVRKRDIDYHLERKRHNTTEWIRVGSVIALFAIINGFAAYYYTYGVNRDAGYGKFYSIQNTVFLMLTFIATLVGVGLYSTDTWFLVEFAATLGKWIKKLEETPRELTALTALESFSSEHRATVSQQGFIAQTAQPFNLPIGAEAELNENHDKQEPILASDTINSEYVIADVKRRLQAILEDPFKVLSQVETEQFKALQLELYEVNAPVTAELHKRLESVLDALKQAELEHKTRYSAKQAQLVTPTEHFNAAVDFNEPMERLRNALDRLKNLKGPEQQEHQQLEEGLAKLQKLVDDIATDNVAASKTALRELEVKTAQLRARVLGNDVHELSTGDKLKGAVQRLQDALNKLTNLTGPVEQARLGFQAELKKIHDKVALVVTPEPTINAAEEFLLLLNQIEQAHPGIKASVLPPRINKRERMKELLAAAEAVKESVVELVAAAQPASGAPSVFRYLTAAEVDATHELPVLNRRLEILNNDFRSYIALSQQCSGEIAAIQAILQAASEENKADVEALNLLIHTLEEKIRPQYPQQDYYRRFPLHGTILPSANFSRPTAKPALKSAAKPVVKAMPKQPVLADTDLEAGRKANERTPLLREHGTVAPRPSQAGPANT